MNNTRMIQAKIKISLKAELKKRDTSKDLQNLKPKMMLMKNKKMVDMIHQKTKLQHLEIQLCWVFQKTNLMSNVMSYSKKPQLYSHHERTIELMKSLLCTLNNWTLESQSSK